MFTAAALGTYAVSHQSVPQAMPNTIDFIGN
jgi:hypothetical protein